MPLSDQEQLNEIQDKLKEQVGWPNFVWIIGILLVIVMAVFGYVLNGERELARQFQEHQLENAKQFNEVRSTYADIQARLSAIQADLEWLKRSIK